MAPNRGENKKSSDNPSLTLGFYGVLNAACPKGEMGHMTPGPAQMIFFFWEEG